MGRCRRKAHSQSKYDVGFWKRRMEPFSLVCRASKAAACSFGEVVAVVMRDGSSWLLDGATSDGVVPV